MRYYSRVVRLPGDDGGDVRQIFSGREAVPRRGGGWGVVVLFAAEHEQEQASEYFDRHVP